MDQLDRMIVERRRAGPLPAFLELLDAREWLDGRCRLSAGRRGRIADRWGFEWIRP